MNMTTKEYLETIANKFISDKSAEIIPYNEKYMMDLSYTKDMCDKIDDLHNGI